MRAFLYDTYGYYPPDEYATSFQYGGWIFKLELHDKSEQEMAALAQFMEQVSSRFPTFGVSIVKTREQLYCAKSSYGIVSLIATKEHTMSLRDVIAFHQSFLSLQGDEPLRVSHLQALWQNKVDRIEEKILPALKIDDATYRYVMESYIHAMGLAENAIQYLNDIVHFYGDEVEKTTLAHKRLNQLDSYTFLNPFNLVVESPMRDLSELYKSEKIDEQTLTQLLSSYTIAPKDASLLFARILFPTTFFDLLEDFYVVKKDIREQVILYYDKRKQKMDDIRNLHQFLVKQYSIRPLSWLET